MTNGARHKSKRKAQVWRGRKVCHYCGLNTQGDQRTIDHIVPLSLGGPSERWNLVAACRKCNTTLSSTLVKCECGRCERARSEWRVVIADA